MISFSLRFLISSIVLRAFGTSVVSGSMSLKKEYLDYIRSGTHQNFNGECADILTILPHFPNDTRTAFQMHKECQKRMEELHEQHAQFRDILIRDPKATTPPRAEIEYDPDPNSYLLILDLDETILDQASYYVPAKFIDHELYPLFWEMVNGHDNGLLMNFNRFRTRFTSRSEHNHLPFHLRSYSSDIIWIAFFRRYFMNVLALTHQRTTDTTWDVMLYSKCNADFVMFHVVAIEMYYNYIYAEHLNLNEYFYFRYVVPRANYAISSRDRGPNTKSMSKVLDVLTHSGPLNKYGNYVVVDDAGDKVWSAQIPQQLMDQKVRILCFQPQRFSFSLTNAGGMNRTFLDRAKFEKVVAIRNQDATFSHLISLLKTLLKVKSRDNCSKLAWIPIIALF